MRIFVDADACPMDVKNVLFRTAKRLKIETIFVANQALNGPRSAFIVFKRVAREFDAADNWIVQQCRAGDLVISADIPLAAQAIEKGAQVISPKGVLFTTDNIKQRLTMRNFMEELRSSGEKLAGPAAFSQTDLRNFANQLDRLLAKV